MKMKTDAILKIEEQMWLRPNFLSFSWKSGKFNKFNNREWGVDTYNEYYNSTVNK